MNCCAPSGYYWSGDNVSSCALHNLTSYCPIFNNETEDVIDLLGSPATFFIQLVRLTVCLALLSILLALYNCINVLDRNILSTATCALLWVLFIFLIAIKAGLLMIFIPLAHLDAYLINLIGFVVTTLLQTATTFILILALDHERRFRSPDYASIDSPYHRHCVGLKCFRQLVCSWFRLATLGIFLIPIALLVAIEIVFQLSSCSPVAPSALVWVYITSLIVTRLVAIVTVIHLTLFTKGNCEPTTPAKVYISVAMVLSIAEDLPNSLFNMSVGCDLNVITVFDLLQLLGCSSLIFYTLFIRSQYLRIEQESKLVLVWDLQKLLQVNGRKDIIRYNTCT